MERTTPIQLRTHRSPHFDKLSFAALPILLRVIESTKGGKRGDLKLFFDLNLSRKFRVISTNFQNRSSENNGFWNFLNQRFIYFRVNLIQWNFLMKWSRC